RRLTADLRPDREFREIPPGRPAARWWNNLSFWRGFGVVAGVAAAALAAVLLFAPQPMVTTGRTLALLADPAAKAHWLVRTQGDDRLVLEAIDNPAPTPGHVFELWAVPPSGQPKSLGVLPPLENGLVPVTLTGPLKAALSGAAALAISEEGPG